MAPALVVSGPKCCHTSAQAHEQHLKHCRHGDNAATCCLKLQCPCKDWDQTILTRVLACLAAAVEELADPSLVRVEPLSAIRCGLICQLGAACGSSHASSLVQDDSLCSNQVRAALQKDKPMAVGGLGMISTANYVARKYGVRSAMPGKLYAASGGRSAPTCRLHLQVELCCCCRVHWAPPVPRAGLCQARLPEVQQGCTGACLCPALACCDCWRAPVAAVTPISTAGTTSSS